MKAGDKKNKSQNQKKVTVVFIPSYYNSTGKMEDKCFQQQNGCTMMEHNFQNYVRNRENYLNKECSYTVTPYNVNNRPFNKYQSTRCR